MWSVVFMSSWIRKKPLVTFIWSLEKLKRFSIGRTFILKYFYSILLPVHQQRSRNFEREKKMKELRNVNENLENNFVTINFRKVFVVMLCTSCSKVDYSDEENKYLLFKKAEKSYLEAWLFTLTNESKYVYYQNILGSNNFFSRNH